MALPGTDVDAVQREVERRAKEQEQAGHGAMAVVAARGVLAQFAPGPVVVGSLVPGLGDAGDRLYGVV